MRRDTLGTALLILGLLVGLAAVAGMAVGFTPALSPFVLRLVVYKLGFAAAAGLLVAGALVRRAAGRGRPGAARAGQPAA